MFSFYIILCIWDYVWQLKIFYKRIPLISFICTSLKQQNEPNPQILFTILIWVITQNLNSTDFKSPLIYLWQQSHSNQTQMIKKSKFNFTPLYAYWLWQKPKTNRSPDELFNQDHRMKNSHKRYTKLRSHSSTESNFECWLAPQATDQNLFTLSHAYFHTQFFPLSITLNSFLCRCNCFQTVVFYNNWKYLMYVKI